MRKKHEIFLVFLVKFEYNDYKGFIPQVMYIKYFSQEDSRLWQ